MKIKLKQATLVDVCKTGLFTIILLIQRKDKSIVEVEFSEKAPKKLSIADTLEDWWHSVKVDGDTYDINIYNEDRGLLKCVMYATKKVEGSKFLEMVDSQSTSAKLRSIPRDEYNICKQGLIKKLC